MERANWVTVEALNGEGDLQIISQAPVNDRRMIVFARDARGAYLQAVCSHDGAGKIVGIVGVAPFYPRHARELADAAATFADYVNERGPYPSRKGAA